VLWLNEGRLSFSRLRDRSVEIRTSRAQAAHSLGSLNPARGRRFETDKRPLIGIAKVLEAMKVWVSRDFHMAQVAARLAWPSAA
jgi:hypothetical protein